ncbi:MAG: biopolymer transport protein ExbD [Pseudoalteromonas tetraodonis]|jgi:biopolymer transport protein ExbD
MKIQRRKLLVEPASSAATDIAFILMIFFLVCASVQPGTGREQTIPRSEEEDQSQQSQNIEVSISPGAVVVDGEPIPTHRLRRKLEAMLAGKEKEEDRVIIVKSSPRVQYQHWISVTTIIEQAGGIITLQLEKQETISVD